MIKDAIDDTIVALATGLGESGIGIVRISGEAALGIADKIFVSKKKIRPSEFKTFTTHYGWAVDNCQNNKIVDEVILTVMRAPSSYTKEDVVEISCHGGIVAMRAVLDLVLANGARLAHPGEFTRRAFLNGRIDLAQAEAVLDIIRAKTDAALKVGVEQLKGTLSKEINKIRNLALEALTFLEATIDFPEEEIYTADLESIRSKVKQVNEKIIFLLGSAQHGLIMREGVRAVICGKPNVGKSSLLNALLKKERSIVTPIPGTTRDTIEEVIDIKGIPVRIVDTAGILKPRDLIEKKAIQRSREQIRSADLVLLLFDGSRKLNKDDSVLINKLKDKTTLAIINKIDLRQRIEKDKVLKNFSRLIELSAKSGKNINLLKEAIADLVYRGKLNISESVTVSNLRHIESLRQAQKLIAEAANSLDNKLSLEFVAQGIKDALACLDGILGKNSCEDLLEKIFEDFCIGK